jgi:hypothetical protein
MKRIIAILLFALLLLTALPALGAEPAATRARTALLDLTGVTSATSSTAEGWAYNPTGNSGSPRLTLNSYGLQNEHSAPIIVPANTVVIVNGNCYIDNVYMGCPHSVLSGSSDGYLKIQGSGTLNLYADQYNGRCIDLPIGGENDNVEFLYIEGVTVNCYGLERDMYNAATLAPCIYGSSGVEIRNAVVNTYFGSCGISSYGYTPIGGVTEATADLILIEDSVVNIQNESANGLWNFAKGISTTFGKIRISGSSDVTINAGSNSIYSYLSFTIDGGRVHILSTPVSTADSAAIVYCNNLCIGGNAESVYFSTVNYPLTKVLYCKSAGLSTLGSGLQTVIGSFSGGSFATAPDEANGGLPALYVTRPGGSNHTVTFYDFYGSQIASYTVAHGGSVNAPAVTQVIDNASGTYVFYGWDKPLTNITSDLNVYPEYLLLGDVDLNGEVTSSDALLLTRYVSGLIDLGERNLFAGDIDMNGEPSSADALLILRYCMGLIPTLHIS